jgi:hypothetical protein
MEREHAEAFAHELEEELVRIDQALADRDQLVQRRRTVDALLGQVRAFLKGEPIMSAVINQPVSTRRPKFEGPIPVAMKRILERHRRWMTAAEVYHAMIQEEGWKPTRAGREVVRGNLIRRSDWFVRDRQDAKLYGLEGWDDAFDRARDESVRSEEEAVEKAPLQQ